MPRKAKVCNMHKKSLKRHGPTQIEIKYLNLISMKCLFGKLINEHDTVQNQVAMCMSSEI